jgi:hypothetical protein
MGNTDTWIGVAVAAAAVFGLIVWYVLAKGRPRPGDHVFRASRLTGGNRIFPSQVIITPTSVTLLKPQWVGKMEESLHVAHVASISIDTNLVFSDVMIESTGGHNPLTCHGHTKGDAVAIKAVIEKYQTEYYRKADTAAPPARPS